MEKLLKRAYQCLPGVGVGVGWEIVEIEGLNTFAFQDGCPRPVVINFTK